MTGNQFRRIRKDLGWKQVELAKILGVDHNTVSRWETGRYHISPKTAFAMRYLADCVVPVGELGDAQAMSIRHPERRGR